MPRHFIVDPPIRGDIHVGTEGQDSSIYIGVMAESGPLRKIHFGGSQEFVALILGKRGSGKSHTLGVIVEGLATKNDHTSISQHEKRRAVLLLDPIGNFWTTAHKLSADGPPKVREQFASLDGWHCVPEDIDVSVYLPAGFKTPNDPEFIQEFSVRIADLDAPDLADLLGINLLKDAQGAALSEAFSTVTEEGWTDDSGFKAANRQYGIPNLIQYLEYLRRNPANSDHALSTLRALIRSLRSLERQPVFSGNGTPLTELLKPGRLGVLMLPHRVGHDLRRVITRLLIRRILREREEASQIRQRLDVETVDEDTRPRLQAELDSRIPRSILAIDEAQELLGDEGGEAKKALEDYCLLGRNYGLSLLLATQRPTAAAISPKVRSQVDIYFVHRLLTQDDIEMCRSNLLAVYPREVRAEDRHLEFTELIRTLDRGQVIIAASHAKGNDPVTRIIIGKVRPRVTVHGGEVE